MTLAPKWFKKTYVNFENGLGNISSVAKSKLNKHRNEILHESFWTGISSLEGAAFGILTSLAQEAYNNVSGIHDPSPYSTLDLVLIGAVVGPLGYLSLVTLPHFGEMLKD